MTKTWDKTHAITHYAGVALLLTVGGIIWLTHDTLTYEGNDIAQAGILIGILGTVATGILGFMSGIVLGRRIATDGKETESASPTAEAPGSKLG